MSSPFRVEGICSVDSSGSAILKINPVNHPQGSSSSEGPTINLTRPVAKNILQSITNGTIPVHPSRRPMSLQEVRTIITNVARTYKFSLKQDGLWSTSAQNALLEKLMTEKNKNKASHKKQMPAITDAEDQIPAIMDEQIEEDIQMEVPSGGDDHGDHNQGNRPLVDNGPAEDDPPSSASSSDSGTSSSSSSGSSTPAPVDYRSWDSDWHDTYQNVLSLYPKCGDDVRKKRAVNHLLKSLVQAKAAVDRV